MSSLRRPPAEIAALRQRRDQLFAALAKLQEKRDLETRVEEQLRLDPIVAEHKARLAEAEAAVQPFELVEKADDLERKQSWAATITAWEQLAVLRPEAAEPRIEIARLRERERFSVRLQQVTIGVMSRRQELGDLWPDVRSSLQNMRVGDTVNEEGLILIDELLAGRINGGEFIRDWQAHREASASPAVVPPPFKILADRLRRGDLVLFLGSELAHESDGRWPGNDKLAANLAELAGAPEVGGSLALIAEYYHLSEYGRSSLLRNLREQLPTAFALPLYQLLAGIAAPLVVVSAAWDTLLEEAFLQAGKPFVMVAPLLASRTGASEMVVRRSDSGSEEVVAAEALSGLRQLAGHSLIFKVRGAIPPEAPDRANSAGTPVLAEREHFAFARRQHLLLPTYLTRLLAERSLLILGLSGRHWEDRLLLDAVLDKRQAADKPFVAGRIADRFARAFWQEHAKRFDISLPELVDRLTTYLRPDAQ